MGSGASEATLLRGSCYMIGPGTQRQLGNPDFHLQNVVNLEFSHAEGGAMTWHICTLKVW